MSFLVVPSPQCPLSRSTRAAWTAAGGIMLKARGINDLRSFLHDLPPALRGAEFVLNSGFSLLTQDDTPLPLVNDGRDVGWTTSPFTTYELLQEFMGEVNVAHSGPFWLKGPGRGGSNSRYVPNNPAMTQFSVTSPYITQKHYQGEEYRINTVGHRIVQVHQRRGPNSAREYNWLGLSNTQRAIKSAVRQAAGRSMEHAGSNSTSQSLQQLAIDCIFDGSSADRLFILEANSSGGVNERTAVRIITEIRRQLQQHQESHARVSR